MVKENKKSAPQITSIPLQHVMAFNAVSAPAYMGQAMGHIWKGADGQQHEVIVIARDIAGLQRFTEDYELEVALDIKKTVPVGMAHAGNLRIINGANFSGDTGGDIPVASPAKKQATKDDEEW